MRTPDIFDVGFIAAGLLALLAIVFYWRARRFLTRVVRTQGRITHFITKETKRWQGEGQGADTETDYLPHVEFSLPDGSRVAFQSRVNQPNQIQQARAVTVVYDPEAPASSAEIEGIAAWFVAWRLVVAFGALSVLAAFMGWAARP